MAKPSAARSNNIPALDGLRGLAAVIVLVSHVSNNVGLWGGVLGHGGGQIGVMIFFVLSGYLMGFLYLDRPFNSAEVWSYAVHLPSNSPIAVAGAVSIGDTASVDNDGHRGTPISRSACAPQDY